MTKRTIKFVRHECIYFIQFVIYVSIHINLLKKKQTKLDKETKPHILGKHSFVSDQISKHSNQLEIAHMYLFDRIVSFNHLWDKDHWSIFA